VVQIAAGFRHTCALLSDGMVRCWGKNGNGELGNGSRFDNPKPTLVMGLTDVTYIAMGSSNTCAVRGDGAVSCWGDNNFGQLGAGNTETSSAVPVKIESALPASKVAAGTNHVCLVAKADGAVQCWGNAALGALGNGSTVAGTVRTPQTVAGVTGVTSIAAGSSFSCGAFGNGEVVCWGWNERGQLGGIINGGGTATGTPQYVTTTHGYRAQLSSQVSAFASGSHVCAATTQKHAICWGYNLYGQLAAFITKAGTDSFSANDVYDTDSANSLLNVTAVSSGENHSCAVLADNTARCWGANSSYQLGNETNVDAPYPVRVALSGVVSISAGWTHTCASSMDGTAWCWGVNDYGKLGDGTNVAQSPSPVKVQNLLP
jgi:alpha-tubulin suppressor-like RCC1 family protein